MDATLPVFPSVTALTLEADDEFIYLRQYDDYQQRVEVVEVPRVFLPALVKALFSSLDTDELKEVGRALASARRTAQVGSNG